jgi:hypothetical protein
VVPDELHNALHQFVQPAEQVVTDCEDLIGAVRVAHVLQHLLAGTVFLDEVSCVPIAVSPDERDQLFSEDLVSTMQVSSM